MSDDKFQSGGSSRPCYNGSLFRFSARGYICKLDDSKRPADIAGNVRRNRHKETGGMGDNFRSLSGRVIRAAFADTPEAKIILGKSLHPDSIREGTDVYFDCTVNAHPSVYKVEWRHNVSTSSVFPSKSKNT